MTPYLPIRQSQASHYLQTPIYVKDSDGEYALYKPAGVAIDLERFAQDAFPQLFIAEQEKDLAFGELQSHLIRNLKDQIMSGNLYGLKSEIFGIVKETFAGPFDDGLSVFPETIDVLYNKFSVTSKLLTNAKDIGFGGSTLVEHSINVMVLVLNYCMFSRLDQDDTKQLSLSALLHDIGLVKLPRELIEVKRKLKDSEFEIYKTHPSLGHDIVLESEQVVPSISKGVLEHHERLDGSGYPRGISNLSFAGRLIGLLDCFDSLTSTEKEHRKRKNPFGALRIIQEEIKDSGNFDKTIFRDVCLSLIGKRQYSGE